MKIVEPKPETPPLIIEFTHLDARNLYDAYINSRVDYGTFRTAEQFRDALKAYLKEIGKSV